MNLPKKSIDESMLESGAPTTGDRRIPLFITDNLLRRLLLPPKKIMSKHISAGQVVADIGSGPGHFTIAMAEIVGREGKVYAVDFDEKSIEALTRKAAKHGYSKIIQARATSASDLRFIPDSSVDFVFANGLLCCMTDHYGAIREMQRILKKDKQGKAYLSVTKRFLRKKDPRTVGKEEWDRLLGSSFDVLTSGEGFVSRWATVAVSAEKDDEQVHLASGRMGNQGSAVAKVLSAACSCCSCTQY